MPRPPRPLRLALALLLALAAGPGPLAAAPAEPVIVERERYLMGTRFTILLQGDERASLDAAASAAFDEVARYEDVTSNWRADSELSRLHAALAAQGTEAPRPVAVSADLFAVLAEAKAWSVRSEGAFDATVEPLTRAWDLRGDGRVPAEEEIAAARGSVDGRAVVLDEAARTVRPARAGAGFDLGGIAKGAALDRAVDVLRARGVTRALLNFGGQVYGLGAPLGAAAWSVELADPRDRARGVATVSLRDRSVSTTAASERSLEAGGKRINHILDPRTGRPAPAWGAAVVVAARGVDADAASTALYVLGPVAGRTWAAQQPDLEATLLVEDPAAPGGLRIERVTPEVAMMAAAQGPGDAPDNAELARRIEVLSGEVEDLKLGEVAAPAGGSRFGLGPAASKVYGVGQGVSIGGYGETLYENFAGEREDGVEQFTPDQLDLLRAIVYVGYKFSDRLLFNSELEFEHATTGKRGSVSVEFAYLDYMVTPLFNLRGGMILPPMGFVNELHEPPTFLGARRPDVEQRILPSTWRANGIGAFGESESGFAWRAYLCESFRGVANAGQGIAGFRAADGVREARQSGSFSRVEDWGVTGLVEYRRSGFRAGVSAFTGGAAQGDTTIAGEPFTGRTSLWEAHGEYQGRGLSLRALYARGTIDEAERFNERNGFTGNASVGSSLFGWYGEAGYDVLRLLAPGSEWNLTPYLRYEQYDTQDEVPAGYARNPAHERTVLTAGAALFPHPQVVLKADYQWRTNEAETGIDQLNVALGYLF
jgi:thiamine biosynthesis lipoprotein ApbE